MIWTGVFCVAREPKHKKMYVLSVDFLVVTLCVAATVAVSSLTPNAKPSGATFSHLEKSMSAIAPLLNQTARLTPEQLKAQLSSVAAATNRPAISAKVDVNWRLIPGLNGVTLNEQATIDRVKWTDNTVAPRDVHLVYQQIPPTVDISNFVAEPIYRGNPQKREMSLMFNVAWGTEYVPQILNILHRYHVRSTFFLDGSWTKKNPLVAKSILDAGMELGNHGYNHPMMSRISRDKMISQIQRTNTVIQQATGVTPTLFAPPAGDFNQMVVRVAAGLKMRSILWTLDTIDWRKPQPSVIVSRIVKRHEPGALVLMHPTAPTVSALPSMIEALQKAGYRLVPVSELISPVRPTPATLADYLGTSVLSTYG